MTKLLDYEGQLVSVTFHIPNTAITGYSMSTTGRVTIVDGSYGQFIEIDKSYFPIGTTATKRDERPNELVIKMP